MTPDTPDRSRVHVSDPSALRALAHPLRLRVLGTLRTEGPQTVGMLGEALDAAPGSISYHLGTLEKHGFVEEAPELAQDARQRWWRATADVTTFDFADFQRDPQSRAAGRELRQMIVQRYAAELLAYLDVEPTLEPDWVAASTLGDDHAWLTSAELRELSDELEALAERWHARGDRDRAGARPVRLIYSAARRP